jgi:DNA-binding response OmpR family regulator
MKVLLVDDDPDLLEAAATYLKLRGIEVLRSHMALGVTPVVREHRPEAVVLDVMMPMMSGTTLANHLKHLSAMQSVPIIFFSAMDEEKLRLLAREANARYVSKADGFLALYQALVTAVAERIRER